MFSVTDAQRLYQQWQDGKLLDNEERQALRAKQSASESLESTFADVLKSAAENSSSN